MTTAKSFDDRAYIKAALALGHLLMHPSSASSSPSPPPVTSASLRPTSSPSPCNANPVFLLAGNEEPINLSEAYSYDERQASSAYHFVQSSVVSVHARNSYYFNSQDIVNQSPPTGSCTGIIWDSKGHVVCPASIVRGVIEVKVTLNDGDTYTAKVLGSDFMSDLAALKLGIPKGLAHSWIFDRPINWATCV